MPSPSNPRSNGGGHFPRKDLLKEAEVNSEYGFSLAWLRRCRLERRGPRYIKINRKMVRYRRAEIEAYLDLHVVETGDR